MRKLQMKINRQGVKLLSIIWFITIHWVVIAGTEWFSAGFTGLGTLDTESRGGHWEDGEGEGVEFSGARLSITGIAKENPVKFVADAKHNAFNESRVLTIESVITCYGYDELPAPPEDTEVKSAVIASDAGEMYVLGYDYTGKTNRWVDSGIVVPFGAEITVRATFAYSNVENTVTYEFNGQFTRPIPVRKTEVQSVGYVGSGEVDELSGAYAAAPVKVKVKTPTYDGITVILSSTKTFEYPGNLITLKFVAKAGTVSRTSAVYRLLSDGTLEFADSGKPPRILTAEDLKYPEFIRDESSEVRSRYDVWSSANKVNLADADVEAYLLNCSPSVVMEELGKFMIISIRESDEGWVVKVTGDKGEGERYGNGYVHIKSVKGSLVMSDEPNNGFFQAEVRVSPP